MTEAAIAVSSRPRTGGLTSFDPSFDGASFVLSPGKIVGLDVIPVDHPQWAHLAGAWLAFYEVTESNVPTLIGTIGIVGGVPATDLFSAPSDWVYGPWIGNTTPEEIPGGPLAWWQGHVPGGLDSITWEVVSGNIAAKLNPSD